MINAMKQRVIKLVEAMPKGAELSWTTDLKENEFAWITLKDVEDLPLLAEQILPEGRLVTVSACNAKAEDAKSFHEVCYHFVMKGLTVTVTVLPTGVEPTVPSITQWHKSADWTEREMAESYGITVANHPNPRPLFLHEAVQSEAMERLVPLSTMTNSASTNALWEKIMGEKG
ncbi:NADH-quinone oxidoreductase subunit C [Halodesulfovibrio marinisediminis]|uniref:NADH dehydrogenase subunit C n=1 Tax=Halodesulfovibrio marinisediminis DSM 17456 TaxID=1121457 RepID=A0A1N6H7F2_9BACT|nr:NADH-quinone oxidoreductase subunit C [Halodesulfovibrio marinisediminis]SIO15699.1 NADH dehydrogenase subunit C [Halodesulfovibrio marinisediminis DSM 17456]